LERAQAAVEVSPNCLWNWTVCFWNSSGAQIYQSPGIIQEIKFCRLRWAGHLQRSQNDRLIKWVWEEAPKGIRVLGRARLRWRDNIIKDLVILDVDQQEWREMTHDRSRWRQIVKAAKTHSGL